MNKKVIIAGVVGVVFLFAGYNLWSYFKEQQAVQLAEDQQAEQRRITREAERIQREADQKAETERLRLEEEQAVREAEERKEQERAEREATEEAERLVYEQAQIEADAQNMENLLAKARRVEIYNGIRSDTVEELNLMSVSGIRSNAEEAISQRVSLQNFPHTPPRVNLLVEGSNMLMLYSMISTDIDILKTFIDAGVDVNSKNSQNITPLMFASAYGSPETVRFLIGQGASIEDHANILNMNSLHLASLLNPNPDVAQALVQAGLPIEEETENGYTAVLLATTENPNFEVAERLAEQGANTKVEDENYHSVHWLAERRMRGQGTPYRLVTPTFNERVLRVLE